MSKSFETAVAEKGVKLLFVFFFLIPVLACYGDRPAGVRGTDKEEGFLRSSGQWISAIFYTFLPLILAFVTAFSGLWHLAILPLTFVVIARRLSARNGIIFELKTLRAHLGELLQGRRVRKIAIYGGAAALLSQVLYMLVGQSTSLPSFPTSAISLLVLVSFLLTWGATVYLAVKASGAHNAAVEEEYAARARNIVMLSKAFSSPLADWDDSYIEDTGLELTITPPPISAVLHYAQADSILALVAPQWEMNLEQSDHTVLVLSEASEATIQRRREEAQSGGLIAGRISGADDDIDAPVVHVAEDLITADDLL